MDTVEQYDLVDNLHVGERLPPPRGVVAALCRLDRAADGWAHRRVEGQDPRRQRSPRVLPVVHGAAVVVGVGESPYYKRGGATESEFQLACIAIQNAVG